MNESDALSVDDGFVDGEVDGFTFDDVDGFDVIFFFEGLDGFVEEADDAMFGEVYFLMEEVWVDDGGAVGGIF